MRKHTLSGKDMMPFLRYDGKGLLSLQQYCTEKTGYTVKTIAIQTASMLHFAHKVNFNLTIYICKLQLDMHSCYS
jgi:hypothetical protein